MSTLHFPRSLEQMGRTIKHTDPAAWVVLALAIGTLAVVLAATYFR